MIELIEWLLTILTWAGGTLLAGLGIYAIVRLATMAYYKSKLEAESEAKRQHDH